MRRCQWLFWLGFLSVFQFFELKTWRARLGFLRTLWPALVSSLSPMSPQVWAGGKAGPGFSFGVAEPCKSCPGRVLESLSLETFQVPVSCAGDCTPLKNPGDKKGAITTWILFLCASQVTAVCVWRGGMGFVRRCCFPLLGHNRSGW